MEMTSRAALVTGAASGLGAATAAALVDRGASVYDLDLGHAIAGATAPDGVHLIQTDVTSDAEVRAAPAVVPADAEPIRIVVNCAGLAPAARVVCKNGWPLPSGSVWATGSAAELIRFNVPSRLTFSTVRNISRSCGVFHLRADSPIRVSSLAWPA